MTTGGVEEKNKKKKTACVTGGNGYIAAALIKVLLEKGYAVKTTVRNPDDRAKNSHLKVLQALGPLEVYRADLDAEGSFDDAVAGCDYAFLIAAPVNLTSDNPEKDQIEPSLRGILNVMMSCVKSGTVRRVVLTSSAGVVCIRPLEGDSHVLDEESWSNLDYVTAEKPPIWGYVVSKVLVEKEALRSAQENDISMVSLCPVLIVGASPVSKVYTSVPAALSLLSGDEAAFEMLKCIEKTYGGVQVVDLDDLCRAQLFVAETETASGRYVCCGFNTTVVEMARSGHLLEKPRVCLSSTKLVREGFEFKVKTLDDTYDGLIKYGKTLGILPW
ncbi:hypothetical protein PR202_gb14270 [Eleusine coracana subsp. coracana]|uniref:NAD-dependent epimerase/dehydratase domain-containing protein n=1 Tax=Eleusine coracana subsp. coracana TaxID=191504 RepID=A0AAV5EUL1_ELECO|nr:hypothetical protein PR202_gb14270 [Eleusine coracana subsp. coracana]